MYGDDNKRKGLKHHIQMLLRRIFPFLLFLLISCENASNDAKTQEDLDIASIKTLINPDFNSLTVGDALDNYKYFNHVEWFTSKTDNGIKFVNALCHVNLDSLVINIIHYSDPTITKSANTLLESFSIQFNYIINADNTRMLDSIDFVSCSKDGSYDKKTIKPLVLKDINQNIITLFNVFGINKTNELFKCIYEDRPLSNISDYINEDFLKNKLSSLKDNDIETNNSADISNGNNSDLLTKKSTLTQKTNISNTNNLDVTTYRNGEPILHDQTERELKSPNENVNSQNSTLNGEVTKEVKLDNLDSYLKKMSTKK